MGESVAKSDFFDAPRFLKKLASGEVDRMATLVAAARFGGAFAFTGRYWAETAVKMRLIGKRDPMAGATQLYKWSDGLCRSLNIERYLTGTVPRISTRQEILDGQGRGVFLVSNHKSYFDIIVVGSVLPVVFVARGDMAKWPFVGPGAVDIGTIMVHRHDPNSRKISQAQVLERLKQGLSVVNFAEGAVFPPDVLGPFRPGLFHIAAGMDIDVVPVTLRYSEKARAGWATEEAAEVARGRVADVRHEASMVEHMISFLSGPPTRVEIHFGAPIRGRDYPDSTELLQLTRSHVQARLAEPPPWDRAATQKNIR